MKDRDGRMGYQIGPGALDPMRGYSPNWSPAADPQGPRGGSGGHPLRRLALMVGLLVVVLAQLPTDRVQADSYSGSGVSCTTQAHTLTTFAKAGWYSATIQFRLTIPAGGTVVGRWVSSTGWVGVADAWSAGQSGSEQWWIPGSGDASHLYVQFSGSGSMSYVVSKAASYGGCFSVDNVIVTRTPVIGSTPVVVDPSAQPSQSAAPPSSPPGGPWDETKCTGNSVSTCAEPPAGWCWVGDSVYTGAGVELVPCEDDGNLPTPPPAAAHTLTCTNAGLGDLYGGTTWGEGTETYDVLSGHEYAISWSFTVTEHGSGAHTPGRFGLDRTSQQQHGAPEMWWQTWEWFNTPPEGQETSQTFTGSGAFTPGSNQTVEGRCYSWYVYPTNYTKVTGWIDFAEAVEGDADADGWPDADEVACGSDPNDAQSDCSTVPPSGWPSAPPAQPGEGGGPVDQCEGPDDAALPMCGGTFPPIEFCPEGSDLVMCQGVEPSGSTGPLGGLGSFMPDPSAIASGLDGKIPFAYIRAAEDAMAEAGTPGGAIDMCHEFTLAPFGLFEFCIPEEPFTYVAEWRWFGVALVWLFGMVALYRIAVSVPGNPAP